MPEPQSGALTASPHPPYIGAPEGIRTPGTRLRRPLLYPTELLAQYSYIIIHFFSFCKYFTPVFKNFFRAFIRTESGCTKAVINCGCSSHSAFAHPLFSLLKFICLKDKLSHHYQYHRYMPVDDLQPEHQFDYLQWHYRYLPLDTHHSNAVIWEH